MSIPLASTTLAVWRLPADDTRDGYDAPPARQQVTAGLRAHVGSPSGRFALADERVVITFRLNCDLFDFAVDDVLIDETTSDQYMLAWQRKRTMFGLDHVEGTVYLVQGALTQPATS